MARIAANGIEIEYEICGDGPPLLLVMGLGGQLTDWPQAFVDKLAQHFTVIRFDNRDAGLSTAIDAPTPARSDFIKALFRKGWVQAPYSLDDLAADAAGLLAGLNMGPAHVVGMSMGGMISQLVVLNHPTHVRSLCSIMSNTGDPKTGRPTPKVMAHLARRREPDRGDALATTMEFFSMIGGNDWDADEQRTRTEASLARAFNPSGVFRQSLAIAVAPERTERLRNVAVPSLVVHGLDDNLVKPSGGTATARAIPGSRLMMFPGMGHDIPATRHDEMVDAIVVNAHRSALAGSQAI